MSEPDQTGTKGRRYLLVFVLAAAAARVPAGARNFREAGGQAADLPQEVLARLGGRPHPLRRRITAPGETRIRTLVHAIGADVLDDDGFRAVQLGSHLQSLALCHPSSCEAESLSVPVAPSVTPEAEALIVPMRIVGSTLRYRLRPALTGDRS